GVNAIERSVPATGGPRCSTGERGAICGRTRARHRFSLDLRSSAHYSLCQEGSQSATARSCRRWQLTMDDNSLVGSRDEGYSAYSSTCRGSRSSETRIVALAVAASACCAL